MGIVSNRNTRTRYGLCSQVTIKRPEQCQWKYFAPCPDVSIVDFSR